MFGFDEGDAAERAASRLETVARQMREERNRSSVDGLLAIVRSAGELREIEATVVSSVVAVLRRFDTSWVEIGSALGLTRQAAWDRYHTVEAGFSEAEELLYQAASSMTQTQEPDLEEGRVYTRVELQRLFSIRDATLKNGVFPMRERSEIWLFVTASKQSDRVQYDDRLEGDTLYWQGQTAGRTDDRIILHVEEGTDLLLFYRESKTQYPGAGFEFTGKFGYVSHQGPPPTRFILKRVDSGNTVASAVTGVGRRSG